MRGWLARRDHTTDLEGVVREIAAIVKSYGVFTVMGDRYAAGWVRERFRASGVAYEDATLRNTEGEPVTLDKSAAYLEVEPLFAQGAIAVLDHPTLIRELKLLERRPRAGGKTLVDHPHGAHDDHANALALAAAKCRQGRLAPVAGALESLGSAWGGGSRIPPRSASPTAPPGSGGRLARHQPRAG